jgi:hypothetical protein
MVWSLSGCAPVAVQEEGEMDMDQERFRVKITFDPAVPQAITGFVHLARKIMERAEGVGSGK